MKRDQAQSPCEMAGVHQALARFEPLRGHYVSVVTRPTL